MKYSYFGWTGHQNLGDEALLEANKKLFNSEIIVSSDSASEKMIVGGGTVLPHLPVGNFSKHDTKYCIGVGVRNPEFWNRRIDTIDLPYLFGKIGFDFSNVKSSLKSSLPKNVKRGYSKTNIDKKGVEISRNYHTKQSYKTINDIGFEKIGVRGPISKRILENHGIDARVTGDPALYLEPSKYNNSDSKKIGICLQHDTYKWTNNKEYMPEIIDFLNSIENNHSFVFLPMYPEDININKKIAEVFEDAVVSDYTDPVDVQGFIDEVSSCSLMISEKLHGNILSACSYVPFISLEYRPKNFDFAASIGVPDWNIRVDRITSNRLLDMYEHIIDQKSERVLCERVNKKRQDLEQFVEDIDTS